MSRSAATTWKAWPLWTKIAVPAVGLIGVGGAVAAITPAESTTERPAEQGFLDTATTSTSAFSAATTTQVATTSSTAAPTTTLAPTLPPTTVHIVPIAAPVATAPANDPRFGTCKEAKAHGYGPYYKGQDPEYSWYRDGDSDGITCE